MTTIHGLPEEILCMIFKHCEQSDLKEIQRVCRVWYAPAHITFLNEIYLDGDAAIKLFIDSIDHDPDPAYLKAVRNIEFAADTDDFRSDDVINKKLFYRFPNLKKVLLDEPAFLEKFDDEMCTTFMLNCPKLEKFIVNKDYYPEPEYRDLIYKAKLLVTEVDLEKFEDVSPYGDIAQYLKSFPRLQRITGGENTLLTNFEQVLRILECAPNLTSICMGSGTDDTNAAEKYLTSKPQHERDVLINRLSKINYLTLRYEDDFCVNSLKLILKYFHGLEEFDFCSMDNVTWTDTHTKLFCLLLSDMHRFKTRNIQLFCMDTGILAECFPIIVREALIHTQNNSLKLRTADYTGESGLYLPSYRPLVEVAIEDQLTLSEIAQLFFKTMYNNVDKFTLYIKRDGSLDNPTSLGVYNMILGQMPFLKQVKIDITAEFVDEEIDMNGCEIDLPLVEDFTIWATMDAKLQSLLDSYYFGLPNLKRLKLFYYLGEYVEDVGECRVKLPRYCLESLRLDITPFKTKSINVLKKEADGFFVMEVEVLNTCERHFYRISFNLSSVSRLNDNNLKGITQGKDYLLVRVTIGSLQNLQIVVCGKFDDESREGYCSIYQLPYVMILKNGQWEG